MITLIKNKNKVSVGIKLGIVVFLLSLSACLDKIDLEVPAGFSKSLAIQARLVKGNPSILVMQVSQLFDFTAASRQPVNVRERTLIDHEGNEVELIETGLGKYTAILDDLSPIKIESGRGYKLELVTFDNRRYETTMEFLFEVPKAESISLSRVTKDVINLQGEYEQREELRFSISTPVVTPGGNAGILWDLERSYRLTDSPIQFGAVSKVCYITETVSKDDIKVLDPNDIKNGRIDNFPLFDSPIDHRFAESFYFTAIQYSLSPGAYEYWDNVSSLLKRSGNMFEEPAGKITSNFFNPDNPDDEVFGYFFVTQADTIRLGVDSTDVGNVTRFCPPDVPPPPGGGCPVLTCCDCLAEERSTTTKPDYWK